MSNLNDSGEVIDEPFHDYEIAHHAPSEYVWRMREEREERKRRDREELQDLWREETQRRKRENAALFLFRRRKPARGGHDAEQD